AEKATAQLRQRQFLEPPQGQEEPVIVDRHQRVATDAVLHSQGDDPRKRVVRASADEGMEKVMCASSFAIQLDQQLPADRNIGDAELGAKQFNDPLRI